jgi:hypothetical protein
MLENPSWGHRIHLGIHQDLKEMNLGWGMPRACHISGPQVGVARNHRHHVEKPQGTPREGIPEPGLVMYGAVLNTAAGKFCVRSFVASPLPAWRFAQDKVVAILGRERWSAIIRNLEDVAAKLKGQLPPH